MSETEQSLFDPSNWVSYSPNGLGFTKPNHYKEMLEVAWENADELPFAWRILKDGVCDGCALGTSGMEDWTIDGVHLCMVRLKLLRLNTMPAMDHEVLEEPADLRSKDSDELRDLGRLPYPMVWEKDSPGYRRVSWEEAFERLGDRVSSIRRRDPDRMSFYMTSRGLPNETYYAFQKTARFLGTNNVDTSARICHSPSTSGLKETIGYGATTNSYTDWLGTDLLVLVGTNLANNQPVATKYIHQAKKAGTRVVVVNPYREEGLQHYWIPSTVESALFGTKIMDDYYQVAQGGDAAFFNGALKHLIESDRLDHQFIDRHTEDFEAVKQHVRELSWDRLAEQSGLDEETIREFGDLYGSVDTSVTVWSMGITQHSYGQDNVFALSNLALSQGRIGREKCGLNPIRGHSGVQGGAEMGAKPSGLGMGNPVTDPAARETIERAWGFNVPDQPGLNATESIRAMHEGDIDLLYSVGGNFLETLPDPEYVHQALDSVPIRVFQDLVVNPMMLMEPEQENWILPAASRYETPGGVTETSTERRVIFSPEIPGRRIGEAMPEWKIPLEIARQADPERADRLSFDGPADIRDDISSTIDAYEPINTLEEKGDEFQWGGERLCDGYRFNTSDGQAHFQVANLPEHEVPEGWFHVTTRRGKQFNSMVWDEHDSLTGSARDHVFISESDADRLDLTTGDPVKLRSDHGELTGRIRVTDIASGNLQIHWPEGNVLISPEVQDKSCGIPEYDAHCELIPLEREASV